MPTVLSKLLSAAVPNLVFGISVLLCEESGFIHPVEKSLDSSLAGGVGIAHHAGPAYRMRLMVVAFATVFSAWFGNPCALDQQSEDIDGTRSCVEQGCCYITDWVY